jgi:hypothetical protein
MIEPTIDFTPSADASAFDISNLIFVERNRLAAITVFLLHLIL